MRSSILSGAAVVLTAAQLVSAQTFTSCNPLSDSSCPSDAALGKSVTIDFTKGKSDYFTEAEGTVMSYDSTNGANFVMAVEGQAPTITSTDYIFFGKVSVVLQAAAGTGIVSSFVMESDDLDEIDWEWLGGDTTEVESNFFGKGNTTTYDRALYHPVSTPQTEFHTYTVDWSNESIIWSIDDAPVRTLLYSDSIALGGKNFPQTPMVIKMGNWDGGAAGENAGTIEWAGGLTDWSKAPFTMYVKSVTIEDAQSGATSYTYGDETGSYESIKISKDGSTGSLSSASAASASATESATATGSASGSSASSTASALNPSPSGSSLGSTSAESNSTLSGSGSSSPPFQNPAPSNTTSSSDTTSSSNTTSASNLTSSATPTDSGSSSSSSSTTKSSTSSSASNSASAVLSNTSDASSKYGSIDVAVMVLGLTLGYFLM